MNKLTQIYTDILNTVMMSVEKGTNAVVDTVTNTPAGITIDGENKPLYLPTKEELKKEIKPESRVRFHPCCESEPSGQSAVLNYLSFLVARLVANTIFKFVTSLLNMGINMAHEELKLGAKELLDVMPHPVDKATVSLWTAIMKNSTGIGGDKPFLTVSFIRGGKIHEEKFNRVCKINPTILLLSEDFYGVGKSHSKKANENIKALLEHVFGYAKEQGSSDIHYPYLRSLLEVLYISALHLNTLVEEIGDKDIPTITYGWYDQLDKLSQYTKMFLPQQLYGNRGVMMSNKSVPGIAIPKATNVSSVDDTPPWKEEPAQPVRPSQPPQTEFRGYSRHRPSNAAPTHQPRVEVDEYTARCLEAQRGRAESSSGYQRQPQYRQQPYRW